MTTNLVNPSLLRRPRARAAGVGLLAVAAAAMMLDTGCFRRPRFVELPVSECQMEIRLVSEPAMAPVKVFTGRLLMAPFGFQVRGCGSPSSISARDTWERQVQQTFDEVCGPASTPPVETWMRWCAGGAWCKVPGTSTCANHDPVADGFCTPTPATSPVPDCAVMPPPPGPRIQVMPDPITFPGDTTIGTSRGRLVSMQNAGSGTLTVASARFVPADAMSMGSFTVLAFTCPALSGTVTCTLTVRFQPQPPLGLKQGWIEITYSDGTMVRTERVPVSGTAVAGTLDAAGCTTDPATAGGPRRLCFGSGVERSFTLTATGAAVPVRLALPAGYTLVAPASNTFTVTPGTPVTVTLRGATMPVTAGFLIINRDDGGMPIRIELTSSCPVPPGCG